MKLVVPTSWSELNEWQVEELSYLLLSPTVPAESRLLNIIEVLFKKKNSLRAKWKYIRLINLCPLSELVKYADFLSSPPHLFEFPNLKKWGVESPGPRLNNITVKQFSVADAIFYKWRETGEDIYLSQLVASLYVIGKFDVIKLPNVAELTDKVDIKKKYTVALVYLSVRNYIVERFPTVFPKPKEKQDSEERPFFSKLSDYTPFSKVITAIAMDERQPLGPLNECNHTNVYEFFNVLTESILRAEKLSKL